METMTLVNHSLAPPVPSHLPFVITISSGGWQVGEK